MGVSSIEGGVCRGVYRGWIWGEDGVAFLQMCVQVSRVNCVGKICSQWPCSDLTCPRYNQSATGPRSLWQPGVVSIGQLDGVGNFSLQGWISLVGFPDSAANLVGVRCWQAGNSVESTAIVLRFPRFQIWDLVPVFQIRASQVRSPLWHTQSDPGV